GWYGNIIPYGTRKTGNCMFIPLPSVAPLCGFVATKTILKGEEVKASPDVCVVDEEGKERIYELTENIAKEYAHELGELLSYLQRAYTHILKPEVHLSSTKKVNEQRFHVINQAYPNLKKIHSKPDIYTVADFLSKDECERLIRKASTNMQPCYVKNEETGVVEQDASRTSTNANIPRNESPSITRKILNLLGNCKAEQIETFQVLNYKKGQEFKPHTDGFESATTACGFQDSGRIATVFCYLNDVEAGGTTLFTKLRLEIKPRRGLAVVHFPMSLDLTEDEMTEHKGSAAIDEKWILTTWMWKHWRSDYRYSEENMAPLSDDVI
ncbi:unnamed protein product, partial [Heterosigma akashiwo]